MMERRGYPVSMIIDQSELATYTKAGTQSGHRVEVTGVIPKVGITASPLELINVGPASLLVAGSTEPEVRKFGTELRIAISSDVELSITPFLQAVADLEEATGMVKLPAI